MSSKRIHSSCRPESANTQTTRLTLPSEAVLSLTTNSAFRSNDEPGRNQFGDSMLQEPGKAEKAPKKLSVLNKTAKKTSKEEQNKEKEREKIEYDRQKSKPIQKSVILKEDEKKGKKEVKTMVAESKNAPSATLKLVRDKNRQEQSKTAAQSNGSVSIPKETQAKIDYSGWKCNDKIANNKESAKKEEKESEEQLRSRERNELSRFINEMELRNMELLSNNYELSIENATRKIQNGEIEGIETWKSSLENEFSDCRFERLVENIQRNQRELEEENSGDVNTCNNTTVNEKEKVELENEQSMSQSRVSSMMNMTLSDLQQRNNLFLTEINKGKKLKTESISTLEQIEKTQQKMHRIELEEQESERSEEDDSEEESPTASHKPTKNPIKNRVQRNIISISTPYYECDHLPEVYKERLKELLDEIETGADHTPNPFQLSEQLELHIKLIDQGIRVYRREKMEELVLDKKDLPRDAELRKEAELKILKAKLEQVNNRLLTLNKGAVSKQEIDELVKELKESCLIPKSKAVEVKREKAKKIAENSQKTRQFIQSACANSNEIESDIQEIKIRFSELEREVIEINSLTEEQEHQLRIVSLNEFRTKVEELNELVGQIPGEIEGLQAHSDNMRQEIASIETEFGVPEIPRIEVPGHKQDESAEDIDKLIQHRMREGRQVNNDG